MSDADRRIRGAWLAGSIVPSAAQRRDIARGYAVAVLRPGQRELLHELKTLEPSLTVLRYVDMASVRRVDADPIGLGVSFAEASENSWIATKSNGALVEWADFPGRLQAATWVAAYRQRWVDNVLGMLAADPWDGVVADGDLFTDHVGLDLPLAGPHPGPVTLARLRQSAEAFVQQAGSAIAEAGQLFLPNILDPQRDPNRWNRHTAFGGGFDTNWLGWRPERLYDTHMSMDQMSELASGGLSVLRVPQADDGEGNNARFAVAAATIFRGVADVAIAAAPANLMTLMETEGPSRSIHIQEMDWDLGEPLEVPQQYGDCWTRRFAGGWAAANLSADRRRTRTYEVPDGLVDGAGTPVSGRVRIFPHHGLILRNAS